jgi:hypothetical protein
MGTFTLLVHDEGRRSAAASKAIKMRKLIFIAPDFNRWAGFSFFPNPAKR